MELEKQSRSGKQQPVGNDERVEDVVEHFFGLSLDDQKALLLTACPEIVPRLADKDREDFIAKLRQIPRGDTKLAEPADVERVETRDEVLEDLREQSIGAQEHILLRVCPRVVAALDARVRDDFLRDLDQAIAQADSGDVSPTIH